MSDPLLLYLDHTGEGLPDQYGDGIYGEFEYGVDTITPGDIGLREIPVTLGIGGAGFGTSGFGSGTRRIVTVARAFRPQDRKKLDYRRVRDGVGDWEVEIPGGFELHDWIEADAYILDSTGVLFRGTVWDFEHDEETSTVMLSGPGPAGELQRSSVTTTAGPAPAWEALEDYVEGSVNDWSIDVTEPVVETILNRTVLDTVRGVREDLEEATSIDSTDPFRISNGGIEPTQTCFTMDATDTAVRHISDDEGSDAGEVADSHASHGVLVELQEPGDRVEYAFDPDHHIPQARVGLRWSAFTAPTVRVGFDEIDSDSMTVTTGGENRGLHWDDLRQFGESMRNINSRTNVVIEVTEEAPGTGSFFVDVVAPRDLRYDVTFDNSGTRISNATYLDGPEWYPRQVTLSADRVETENNVAWASIDPDWEPSKPQQLVELTNDDELWTASPADILSVLFRGRTYGYGARPRFTFTWADEGSVVDTPMRGRTPQRLEGWEIRAGTNDLRVVEDLELSGDHLSNIQDLAERAGLRFYTDVESREIVAFHRAQVQDELLLYDPEVEAVRGRLNLVYNEGTYNDGTYGGSDQEPPRRGVRYDSVESTKTTGDGYANIVTVKGAHVDGERIEETVRDETEIEAISRFGRKSEAEHVYLDSSITTETDAKSRAEEMLAEMKLERQFNGSVGGVGRDILHVQDIHPAVEYYVDQWELYSTLEEVQVTDDGVTLDFEGAQADNVIKGILKANERARLVHRAL